MQKSDKPHNLILEARKSLSVSGVIDVPAFDETQIDALTSNGLLCIRGTNLKIENLSKDTGELLVLGEIDSLGYSAASSGGFLKRLFS